MEPADEIEHALKRAIDEHAALAKRIADAGGQGRAGLLIRRMNLENEINSLRKQIRAARRAEERAFRHEMQRAAAEGANFWFRRFFTTLGIANAAAFAALASGLLQADKPAEIASIAAPAMIQFAWGMLTAGSIPLLLWIRFGADDWLSERYEQPPLIKRARFAVKHLSQTAMVIAATFSVVDFAQGLFMALGSIQGIIRH